MEQIRLDKAIATQTTLSRREVKLLAARGKILVNGAVTKAVDCKIDRERDLVTLEGRALVLAPHAYLMLHKPRGVVCATQDQKLPTVLDLVPEELRRGGLFPAGRLDKDTEGFVLMTDDGELAHRILAPHSHLPKTYLVTLDRPVGEPEAHAFAQGLTLPPEPNRRERLQCLPAALTVLEDCQARVILRQGLYHQIKRMFAMLGFTVTALRREAIGELALDGALAPGECRPLTAGELELLQRGAVPEDPAGQPGAYSAK